MGNGMGFNMGNGMGYGYESSGIILFMILFFVGLVCIVIFSKNYMFSSAMGNSNSTYTGRRVAVITGVCSICGRELEQGWRICPYCGKELKA